MSKWKRGKKSVRKNSWQKAVLVMIVYSSRALKQGGFFAFEVGNYSLIRIVSGTDLSLRP